MRLRRTAALTATAALLLAACAPAQQESRPATGAVQQKGEGLLRQTPEQVASTIQSLRRLDDLPMYAMTYHGSYDAEAPLTPQELARQENGWACSLFVRDTPQGPEFGRNFDWDPNPAMIVHADPPDGYASMSIVDAFYVLDERRPADLKSPADRRRLAHAVLAPFDGMNEKGLAIGLAATPDARLPAAEGRKTVSTLRIIRLVLDRAASVEEAVALMKRYHVDFAGGPQVHYLIADRAGRSVVVEYGEGRLNVIEDRILTNIALTGTKPADRLTDQRYRLLAEGVPTEASGLELLRRVAQGHTRWSVVYDLAGLKASLVTLQRWDTVRTVSLSSPG